MLTKCQGIFVSQNIQINVYACKERSAKNSISDSRSSNLSLCCHFQQMVLIKYNINGIHVCCAQVIENTRMAQKLIKHCSEDDKITFIIRRIPNGKIFAVRRSENGESLGIRREGGTGEVSVD